MNDLIVTESDDSRAKKYTHNMIQNRRNEDYPVELTLADNQNVFGGFPKLELVVNDGESEITNASVKVSWSFDLNSLAGNIPAYVIIVVGSNVGNMLESISTYWSTRYMFSAQNGEGFVQLPKSGLMHIFAIAVDDEETAKLLIEREKHGYTKCVCNRYPQEPTPYLIYHLCAWAHTFIEVPKSAFAQRPESGFKKAMWDYTYHGKFTIYREPPDQCNFRHDASITFLPKSIALFARLLWDIIIFSVISIFLLILITITICITVVGIIIGFVMWFLGFMPRFDLIKIESDPMGFFPAGGSSFMDYQEKRELPNNEEVPATKWILHPLLTLMLIVAGILQRHSLHEPITLTNISAVDQFTILSVILFFSFHLIWWHSDGMNIEKLFSRFVMLMLTAILIVESIIIPQSTPISVGKFDLDFTILFSAIKVTLLVFLGLALNDYAKKWFRKLPKKVKKVTVETEVKKQKLIRSLPVVVAEPMLKQKVQQQPRPSMRHRIYMTYNEVKNDVCLPYEQE